MTIENIYIDGFKNIYELNVNLQKINIFLSTNNYGKSNILTGIKFAFDFIKNVPKVKTNMMSWNPGMPFTIKDFGKSFKFEVNFSSRLSNESVDVKYGFEFNWKKNSSELGKIIAEYLKLKKEDSPKFVTYIERNDNTANYRTSLSGRCDKDILINSNELIVNKIAAFDELFYLDIVDEINKLDFFADRHFDPNNLFEIVPFVEKNIDESSPFNDNSIARTLFFLKREHKKRYELIVNTLIEFFPYISAIKIKEISLSEKNINVQLDENAPFEVADCVYTLNVTNKNLVKTIPFALMSDGVKRILSLLTYMTLADINKIPVIGVEEPENSIHPGLLKKYIDVIDGFVENSRIIVSSHSPYLTNYINLSNLYIGAPNDDGRAIFKHISKNGIDRINKYSEEMGIQSGEYLFSVMNGSDEFDITLLKKYLENE